MNDYDVVQDPNELADYLPKVPLFRWIQGLAEPNEALILAVCSNLVQVGDAAYDLGSRLFSGNDQIVRALPAYLEKAKGKVSVSYREYRILGYDGDIPEEYTDPVQHLKVLKKSVDFKQRGLYLSDSGRLMLNPNIFAKFVLKRISLVEVPGQGYYTYLSSGKWESLDEDDLGRICRDFLHQAEANIWRSSWHREYLSAISLEVPKIEQMDGNMEYINVQNGMLHLHSMELIPHAREFYSTVQISTKYVPEATCPKFLQFLDQVFEGDQERIKVIQEILGYSITKDMRMQKAFLMVGKGANGKSVLAEIMRLVAGTENVSNVSLSRLSERFGLDALPGKVLNISTENELGDKYLNTESFKAITGSDVVNVEQKFKTSFSCRLYCKLVILLNKLPKTTDFSHGYYRRLTIIPFNRIIAEHEQNKNLVEELSAELEGILTFALEGYQRLLRQDFLLTKSKAIDDALKSYKDEQNPVLIFLRENLTSNPNSRVKRSLLFPAFERWCSRHGFEVVSRARFWDLFRASEVEFGKEFVQKKIQGDFYIDGVELTTLEEDFFSI